VRVVGQHLPIILDVIGEVHAGSSACGGEVLYSLRSVAVRGSSFRSRLLQVSPLCFLVVTCTCTTLVLSWPISVPCVGLCASAVFVWSHIGLLWRSSLLILLLGGWYFTFHFVTFISYISLTVGRSRGRGNLFVMVVLAAWYNTPQDGSSSQNELPPFNICAK